MEQKVQFTDDKFDSEEIGQHIKHMKVYDNLPLEFRRIYDRLAYYVNNPSHN